MEEKILSICIPNYNQGEALSRNIKNLAGVAHIRGLEILISDNGSTDTKSEIAINEARANLPGVKIFTGESKARSNGNWFSGFGANLDRLIQNSNGYYVWFLGSGDLINLKYFNSLMEILKSKEFDNLILNSLEYSNDDLANVVKWSKINSDSSRISKASENYSVFKFDHSISCNITKRNVFLNNKDELNFQDSWPHVEYYVKYISTHDASKTRKISEKLLLVDQPIDGWYTRPDAIEIYLQLGQLYNSVYLVKKTQDAIHKKELFRNRIVKVVALIISIRLLSKNSVYVSENTMHSVCQQMPVMKKIYLKFAIYFPYRGLRFLRKINSILLKIF